MPMIVLFVALLLLGGISYYLSLRCFQCIRYVLPHTPRLLCIIFFALLVLFVVLGFIRSMLPISASAKHALATISAYCMGFFIYLLIFTVLADLVVWGSQLCKLIPHNLPLTHFISGLAALLLTFTTVGYGIYHARQLQHVSYDVTTENALTDDWNIVLISDLHLGAVGSEERLDDIVTQINRLEPDIICIAGDFFDNDFAAIKQPQKAADTLKTLRAKHGVYACPGNHDAGATVPQMRQFLIDCNITLLEDSYTVIQNELVLVGRLDSSPIGNYSDAKRTEADKVLSGIDAALPIIVMDHNPANIHEYGSNVDLVISGHTHKGQIFPGSIITNLMYTVDYGYYQLENGPTVIVTSGVGTWGMPIRVGTDCEIVQIALRSSEQ